MHVVGGPSLLLRQPELLAVSDIDVRNVKPEDGVERADDELRLAGFLEDSFESVVDHRVDVLGDGGCVFHTIMRFRRRSVK